MTIISIVLYIFAVAAIELITIESPKVSHYVISSQTQDFVFCSLKEPGFCIYMFVHYPHKEIGFTWNL